MGSCAHKRLSDGIERLQLVISLKLALNVVDEFVSIREAQIDWRDAVVGEHHNWTRRPSIQLASLAWPGRQWQHRKRLLPHQMGRRESSMESSVAGQRLLDTGHLEPTHLSDRARGWCGWSPGFRLGGKTSLADDVRQRKRGQAPQWVGQQSVARN